ncbi:hypothetical protein D3C72_471070 [compost metagenome]
MAEPTTDIQVRHNEGERRFEAEVDNHLALCEYAMTQEGMCFTHTEVPSALSGRGIGSLLAKAGMDHARRAGLQVVPQCAFIAAYVKKHPECHDLVHPDHRQALGIA